MREPVTDMEQITIHGRQLYVKRHLQTTYRAVVDSLGFTLALAAALALVLVAAAVAAVFEACVTAAARPGGATGGPKTRVLN